MTRLLPPHDAARRALRGLVPADADDADMQDAYARAIWSSLVEPGDRVAARLIAECGAPDALEAVRVGVASVSGEIATPKEWTDARARWQPRWSDAIAGHALDTARRAGVILVRPSDPDWPAPLDDLGEHAPLCLWMRGHRAALARLRPAVALVGARAASGYGEHVAGDFAAALAGTGIAVVSGAAYGIDGAAHRAALSSGGLTVAVLAGGVERPYPAGHTDLIGRIAAQGLLISETPCGTAPTKWRFLQRNRLIAALSDATVVIEAGWRSGSLNTAAHAAAIGRPLGAVPGPVTSATSAGCHRMLREFDARCVTTADEVRELLGDFASITDRRISTPGSRPLTDDRTRVRDALSTRVWRTPDDVARRAGMIIGEVEGLLGLLHLDGEVEQGLDGWRMLSRAP
ncbi:DNA-processing protein DprA [Microbacterium sp. CJ88]|uniref:DNA-processing protein DprA n=1 Tax=Microbacterium sp. CJ88 TaxID=3445672 RepID=UPI003F659F35